MLGEIRQSIFIRLNRCRILSLNLFNKHSENIENILFVLEQRCFYFQSVFCNLSRALSECAQPHGCVSFDLSQHLPEIYLNFCLRESNNLSLKHREVESDKLLSNCCRVYHWRGPHDLQYFEHHHRICAVNGTKWIVRLISNVLLLM